MRIISISKMVEKETRSEIKRIIDLIDIPTVLFDINERKITTYNSAFADFIGEEAIGSRGIANMQFRRFIATLDEIERQPAKNEISYFGRTIGVVFCRMFVDSSPHYLVFLREETKIYGTDDAKYSQLVEILGLPQKKIARDGLIKKVDDLLRFNLIGVETAISMIYGAAEFEKSFKDIRAILKKTSEIFSAVTGADVKITSTDLKRKTSVNLLLDAEKVGYVIFTLLMMAYNDEKNAKFNISYETDAKISRANFAALNIKIENLSGEISIYEYRKVQKNADGNFDRRNLILKSAIKIIRGMNATMNFGDEEYDETRSMELLLPFVEIEKRTVRHVPMLQSSEPLLLISLPERSERGIIKLFLAKHHIEIIESETGADTLAKIAEAKPNLVIMDFAMKTFDGKYLCEAIKNSAVGADIPLVSYARTSTKTAEEQQYKSWVRGRIQAPVVKSKLVRTLEKFVPLEQVGEVKTLQNLRPDVNFKNREYVNYMENIELISDIAETTIMQEWERARLNTRRENLDSLRLVMQYIFTLEQKFGIPILRQYYDQLKAVTESSNKIKRNRVVERYPFVIEKMKKGITEL